MRGEPSPTGAGERYDETFALDPEERYLVHNRTPWEIRVDDPQAGDLRVAPLGRRIMCGARLDPFGRQVRRLRQRHFLRVRRYAAPSRHRWWRSPTLLLLLAVAVFLPFAGWAVFRWGTVMRAPVAWAGGLAGLLVAAAIGVSVHSEERRRSEERELDAEEADIAYGLDGEFYEGDEFTRKLWQIVNLIAVVVIGGVLPAVTIFFGTELHENVDFTANGIEVVAGQEGRVISRLIQMTYVAVLALFPALMYFQFDRQRVGTLRGQWIRGIFRLDGRVRTLGAVHARYGDRIGEASSYSTDSVRFLGGRRSPIIVATILITLGWTLLVLRTDAVDFGNANQAANSVEQANAAADSAEAAARAAADDPTRAEEAAAEASAAAAAADGASRTVNELATTGSTAAPGDPPQTTVAGGDDPADGGSATGGADDGGDQPADGETSQSAGGADDPADPAEVAAAAAAQANAAAKNAELESRGVASLPFFQLLNPRPAAAAMAFLGGYFFAVHLILRGYFRGDLRPKVYNQITARLVTVVIIAYLINAMFLPDATGDNRMVWALAFLGGIVPTTLLRRLGEVTGQWPLVSSLFGQAFSEERPLTLIDGIDVYERDRLASEGLTDVEALAHNDIVDTMVKTRLPIERLIDWTDQAVLILHAEPPQKDGKDGADPLPDRTKSLRMLGIRTAWDLTQQADHERTRIQGALGANGPSVDQLVRLVESEPAFATIRQWRTSVLGEVTGTSCYIDGSGELQPTTQPCCLTNRRAGS